MILILFQSSLESHRQIWINKRMIGALSSGTVQLTEVTMTSNSSPALKTKITRKLIQETSLQSRRVTPPPPPSSTRTRGRGAQPAPGGPCSPAGASTPQRHKLLTFNPRIHRGGRLHPIPHHPNRHNPPPLLRPSPQAPIRLQALQSGALLQARSRNLQTPSMEPVLDRGSSCLHQHRWGLNRRVNRQI